MIPSGNNVTPSATVPQRISGIFASSSVESPIAALARMIATIAAEMTIGVVDLVASHNGESPVASIETKNSTSATPRIGASTESTRRTTVWSVISIFSRSRMRPAAAPNAAPVSTMPNQLCPIRSLIASIPMSAKSCPMRKISSQTIPVNNQQANHRTTFIHARSCRLGYKSCTKRGGRGIPASPHA